MFNLLTVVKNSQKYNKNVFTMFYNRYMSKISESKNQVLKLRFKI